MNLDGLFSNQGEGSDPALSGRVNIQGGSDAWRSDAPPHSMWKK